MTQKQQQFIIEYLKDFNGTQAAIRAGYSPKTAQVQSAKLLSKGKVAAAVAQQTQARLEKADLTAERTLEEMRRLAFANVQDLFDAAGNLRPIHTLTREQAACIASLEVIVKNAAAGDGHQDIVHKVKVWDKPRTLELLGKHFALLVDRVKVEGDEALIAALHSGRARAGGK